MTTNYLSADGKKIYSENRGGWSVWVIGEDEADGFTGTIPAERLAGAKEITADEAADLLGVAVESLS